MEDLAWIVILVALIGIAVGLGVRRSAPMFRDPDIKAARRLPYRERWRLARLARSDQPITDPDDARNAELVFRAGVKNLEFLRNSYRPRSLIPAAIFIVIALFLKDFALIGLALITPLLWVAGVHTQRRALQKMRLTARKNGWEFENPDVPAREQSPQQHPNEGG